jgi:hypothetical protein
MMKRIGWIMVMAALLVLVPLIYGLVKKQYALLVVLCALSIFFGTEFTNVKVNSQIMYDAVRGQVTVMDTVGSTVDRVMDAKILDDYINDYIESGNEKAAERLKALHDLLCVTHGQVHLGDEHKSGHIVAFKQLPQGFGVSLHPVRAADDQHRIIQHLQGALGLGGEIHMARGIQQAEASLPKRHLRLL